MDEKTVMVAEISRIIALPSKREMDEALLALVTRAQAQALCQDCGTRLGEIDDHDYCGRCSANIKTCQRPGGEAVGTLAMASGSPISSLYA